MCENSQGGDEDKGLPSPSEVLGELAESEKDEAERGFRKRNARRGLEHEAAFLHVRGLQSHYQHKDRWSWFVGGCIAVMLVFQMVLLWLVGIGVWDFHEYDWLLPALMVQNLGQIIALATIVVRSLFRND